MPTETEFLLARDAFRSAAETARRPVAPLLGAFGPEVLTGGALTADTGSLLDTHTSGMRTLADSWERMADECAWRARVCAAAYAARAAYERAYDHYSSEHSSWEGGDRTSPEPQPPSRPAPPPAWVRWP